MDFIQTGIGTLATLTLIGGCIAVALLLTLLWEVGTKKRTSIGYFVGNHALLLMAIVALTGTLGSLFLSEIADWTPCKLCWFQRIFLYPQAILLWMAVWKKDRSIGGYILVLSIIGMLIAAEHYREQVLATLYPPETLEPCDTTGVSCAHTYTFRYGYITVPMMALTAFALNTLGAIGLLRTRRAS